MARGNPLNLAGKRFGRLMVIRRAPNRARCTVWLCKCDCGIEKEIATQSLRSQLTKSCGCLHDEFSRSLAKKFLIKHGLSKTREFQIWKGMQRRCKHKHAVCYKNYGARGITICDRWNKFENFLKDMGKAPSDLHSIDRINVNGNYELKNCRWATHLEQMNNTRLNVKFNFRGELKTLPQIARETGIKLSSLRYLVIQKKNPMSIEEAVNVAAT